MSGELQSLYQRTVLEHCRSPRNFRAMDEPDRVAEGFNPLCGDKVTVYLRTPGREGILPSREDGTPSFPGKEGVRPGKEGVRPGKEGVRPGKEGVRPGREGILPSSEGGTPSFPEVIAEISFEAAGCAICLASASMMTQLLDGEAADQAKQQAEKVLEAFKPGADNGLGDLGEIVALGSVRSYPSRIRCVTLPWRTFTAALDEESGAVSTE